MSEEQIRKMPDFIVVKDSNIAYVEIKYRTSGNFDFNKEYNKKGLSLQKCLLYFSYPKSY